MSLGLQETASPSTLQAVIIFLTALDLAAVALRLYTRHVLGQSVKVDDWFAVISFFFVLALAIYLIYGISEHHVGYRVPDDFTGESYHPLISGSLKHFWVWCLLLYPTLCLIKCSFILFYRRVFVTDKRNLRDSSNIVMIFSLVLVTLWSLGFGLMWTFACNPLRGFWSFPYGETEGNCVDTWLLNRVMSISDFLVDVLILLIPVPLVWRLHLKTTRKLAVLFVFFLGALAVLASVMRMVRIIWASSTLGADADGLLVNTTVLFWGMIEANLGLLAACLPTLRGLFKTQPMHSFFESSRTWLKSSHRSNSKSGAQDGLPLTLSPVREGRPRFSEYKRPGDITLTTMDSVGTSV